MSAEEDDILKRLMELEAVGMLTNPALKRLAARLKAGGDGVQSYSRLHHRHSRS